MKRGVIIFISILILLIALVVIFFIIQKPKASADVTENQSFITPKFFSQDPQVVSNETNTRLEEAKQKATLWKDDSALVAYQISVPIDLNVTSITHTFVFGSPTDLANWWVISIYPDGKFVRASIPRTDFLNFNLKNIDFNQWQKNYLEVLQIAETNGGLKFRASNPDAQISMILQQSWPRDQLWWNIEYKTKSNNLKFRINAFDGRLYDDYGNPIESKNTTPNSLSIPAEIK